MNAHGLPAEVDVEVEVPRGSFVKRSRERGVEYVSPVPSPFDYGCAPALLGADGDPVDVIVLSGRGRLRVWGVVRFTDDGHGDDKLVCADRAPTREEWARIERFFRRYQHARRLLNRLRGRRGETRFWGVTDT